MRTIHIAYGKPTRFGSRYNPMIANQRSRSSPIAYLLLTFALAVPFWDGRDERITSSTINAFVHWKLREQMALYGGCSTKIRPMHGHVASEAPRPSSNGCIINQQMLV